MSEKTQAKLLLLTFDMEEFFGNMYGLGLSRQKMYELSLPGAERLVALGERLGFRATFFFTLKFAEFCPDIVKALVAQGHEIACHGYHHDHDYSSMPETECRTYLSKSKQGLEDMTGKRVVGFRAPQFYHPTHALLKSLGFEYDSSVHPSIFQVGKNFKRWLIGGRKASQQNVDNSDPRISFRSRHPFYFQDLLVLPVSVTPWVALPYSWVWFRNAGLGYAKLCARMTLVRDDYIHLYFHPYDFSDLDCPPYNQKLSRLFVKNTGIVLLDWLESFMKWGQTMHKLQTSTLQDFAAGLGSEVPVIDHQDAV